MRFFISNQKGGYIFRKFWPRIQQVLFSGAQWRSIVKVFWHRKKKLHVVQRVQMLDQIWKGCKYHLEKVGKDWKIGGFALELYWGLNLSRAN